MNKRFIFSGISAVVITIILANWNFNQKKNEDALSGMVKANVEALAQTVEQVSIIDDPDFCQECSLCSGNYTICESQKEQFLSDAHRNCSASVEHFT